MSREGRNLAVSPTSCCSAFHSSIVKVSLEVSLAHFSIAILRQPYKPSALFLVKNKKPLVCSILENLERLLSRSSAISFRRQRYYAIGFASCQGFFSQFLQNYKNSILQTPQRTPFHTSTSSAPSLTADWSLPLPMRHGPWNRWSDPWLATSLPLV